MVWFIEVKDFRKLNYRGKFQLVCFIYLFNVIFIYLNEIFNLPCLQANPIKVDDGDEMLLFEL